MSLLFHKTFASGLTGADGFDSVAATNGTIAQSGGAGLNGTTGGVTVTRTGASVNTYGYTQPDLSAAIVYRTAWFCDISTITISTNNHSTRLYDYSLNDTALSSLLIIRNLSGVLNLQHYLVDDAGSQYINPIPLTSFPAWMELRVKKSSAGGVADAESQLYFGGGSYAALGQLVSTHTGIIHYTRFSQPTHRVGMRSSNASVAGSLLFDEWTMRDDDTPILFKPTASISVSVSGFGAVAASLKKTASIPSSVSGSGSVSASVQKVASVPVQLSGFGDLSLSLFKEALIPIEVSGCGDVGVMILGRLYGDILIITNERLRVHGMVGETLRVHTPTGGRLWVSPL